MTAAPSPSRGRLANGLRWFTATLPSASVTAVCVTQAVGFRDEQPGEEGLAHLVEHLMFRGSRGHPAGEHFRLVGGHGGMANASTHPDYTDYHQVVQGAALRDVLALEADRMAWPTFTPDDVATEAEVVVAEIGSSVTGRPFGGFPWPALSAASFTDFADAHDGYGDPAQVRALTWEQCRRFVAGHYGPDDAVVTVMGEVDPGEAAAAVVDAFAGIAPRTGPRPGRAHGGTRVPRAAGHQIVAPTAPRAAVALGHLLPDPRAGVHPYLACIVLGAVLTRPLDGRLRALVDTGDVVTVSATCGMFGPLDALAPDLFVTVATLGPDADAGSVAQQLEAAVARLAEDPPGSTELDACVQWVVTDRARRHDAPLTLARAVGAAESLFGRGDWALRLPQLLAAVTPADVRAAAAALTVARPGRAVLLPGRPREGRPGANRPGPDDVVTAASGARPATIPGSPT